MPNKILLAARIFVWVAASFAINANACSCIKSLTTKEHFSTAQHVFVGRVIATHEIKSRPDVPEMGGVAAEFQLAEPIKGNPLLLREGVQSGYGSGDCGVPLLVGATYIFFAGTQGEVEICSGTRPYVQGLKEHDVFLQKIRALSSSPKSP